MEAGFWAATALASRRARCPGTRGSLRCAAIQQGEFLSPPPPFPSPAPFEAGRRVSKAYTALLAGRLEGSGIVEAAVDGRAASTRWQAQAHTRSLRWGGWITTARLHPESGRKHQLRIHMAGLGHPVLGDRLHTPQGATA